MKDKAKTKEQPIEDLAVLRDRCTKEAIEPDYDIATAVNALLHLSLEDYSLEELLQKALDIILSVPSLSVETKGCIFLVEDEPDVLIQKVQKGLAEPLLKECARVPFSKCLCGRAASTKRIEFADHIDERHEVSYEGIAPHGHYCVPILLSGNTIGVINLYLKDGHNCIGREEEFLD
jgi:GAF domain-containing protein